MSEESVSQPKGNEKIDGLVARLRKLEGEKSPEEISVGYLVSVSILARLTDECSQTWYDRIKNGEIPHVVMGGRGKRVFLGDFDEWMRKLPRRKGHGQSIEELPPVGPLSVSIAAARNQIIETIADFAEEERGGL